VPNLVNERQRKGDHTQHLNRDHHDHDHHDHDHHDHDHHDHDHHKAHRDHKRAAQLARRLLFERLWIGAVLVYSGVRVWLADRFFAKYGVNIPVFAVIEVLSSVMYAVASARLVGALIDGKRSKVWEYGLFTVLGFAVPDLFVVIASDHVPRSLYVVFAVAVLCSALFSGYELRKKLRKTRQSSSPH
jgi:cation transport ATPase